MSSLHTYAKPWIALERELIFPRKFPRHSKENTHEILIFPPLRSWLYVHLPSSNLEGIAEGGKFAGKKGESSPCPSLLRNIYVREKACSRHQRWTRKMWRGDRGWWKPGLRTGRNWYWVPLLSLSRCFNLSKFQNFLEIHFLICKMGSMMPFPYGLSWRWNKRLCCCSVAKLCPTLYNPMDCSTPAFPDHHHLPELLKLTFIELMMPSISSSVAPFSSCLQGLFQWVGSSHQAARVLEFQHQSFQWVFRVDYF